VQGPLVLRVRVVVLYLFFFRGLENLLRVSSSRTVLNSGPKWLVVHCLDMLPSEKPFLP
jgi:hypothetical protein